MRRSEADPAACALPHDEMSHSQFVYSAADGQGLRVWRRATRRGRPVANRDRRIRLGGAERCEAPAPAFAYVDCSQRGRAENDRFGKETVSVAHPRPGPA